MHTKEKKSYCGEKKKKALGDFQKRLSHQCSLSHKDIHTPDLFSCRSFVFNCLCVAVVYVHMCQVHVSLLCAACVGHEKGTTNLKDVTCSTASKIYTHDSPISLLAIVPFWGKDCGKVDLGGGPTTTPEQHKQYANKRRSMDRCLEKGLQTLLRWELTPSHRCLVGNWQMVIRMLDKYIGRPRYTEWP